MFCGVVLWLGVADEHVEMVDTHLKEPVGVAGEPSEVKTWIHRLVTRFFVTRNPNPKSICRPRVPVTRFAKLVTPYLRPPVHYGRLYERTVNYFFLETS